MDLLPGWAASASALTAERLHLDLVAGNIANMNTTRTPDGGPYRRRVPIFSAMVIRAGAGTPTAGRGVMVSGIYQDPTAPRQVYDPSHPDADPRGYVSYPNINIVNEMVDLITATRAYEANSTVLNASKNLALTTLELARA
ncbi:MAG: flagellar basal body rod protein FlgC [Clostridia bacterium]|nr:MAG: flagellar basal body rod protein FlgC [Clostridia bacterium]